MAGRGKGGKAGKGVAAKRHKRQVQAQDKISKPALRRLARRGGVKRLASNAYGEINSMITVYLTDLISSVLEYALHAKRKTVVCQDVCYGLKKFGTHMVGYE